jgi:hypothetical protein
MTDILTAFDRVQSYNECSLADLRRLTGHTDATEFNRCLMMYRRAGILSLSSADRYVTADILAAGIREHGETLTHAHRCQ